MKNDEKFNRIRYLRSLEKFTSTARNALKREDFDEELFKQRLLKNAQNFDKIPATELNSSYTKELLNFVNDCLSFSFSKEELLNKVNALDKLKKSQSYKKEKHKNLHKDYE
ncbi:hypothetical protein DMB92_03165 [Campylobacter sp. MIT 99-7217]|uniref:hypothetical protein n=1 Tax=Campylobacter sp. MIT 99-7217 TaxID=535091 RepID=UPI001158B5D8|nr:hypothetical protein [Campylobacter sp. MIT 99-7217]TQR32977.1 hypothetical protein DMB92_03165 [Campylobacter sp. MIT 99-7217]